MDGLEALEVLKDEGQLPDVILLDVMMPGMSGYEVPLKCGWVDTAHTEGYQSHLVMVQL